MKAFLTITFVLIFSVVCVAQSQEAAAVKASNPNAGLGAASVSRKETLVSPMAIKMPAEDSSELAKLQEQANSVTAANKDVIAAFRQYETQMAALNSKASVLITRAALKAKMTIEQLDNSDLTWNPETKAYEWRPRPEKKQGN